MKTCVNIPVEWIESGLTLEEIGAITVCYSLVGEKLGNCLDWTNDIEFEKIIRDLMRRQIINISINSDLSSVVDFNIPDPANLPFWRYYDTDKYGNTIFYHPSNYDGCQYTLELGLWDNGIRYVCYFSESGKIGAYHTLEDAQVAVEEELAWELDEISTSK